MRFYFDGDGYFDSLHAAISSAKKGISLEIYFIASDALGWGIARLLTKKAQEGVRVRLVYDAVGCHGTSADLFHDLRKGGVLVKEYNPLFPFTKKFGRRNHRKFCVVDGEAAFLGGYNFASDYCSLGGHGKGWRDSGVQISEPGLVSRLGRLFEESWEGKRLSVRDFIRRRRQGLDQTDERLRIVPTYGWVQKSLIREEYLTAIIHAKKSISITNPYFVPDLGILRALARAAKRGVDVRVLTAGVTDVRVAHWAGQATYGFLLRRGVRIFEYQKTVLHAKSAVIDDAWFTVGTANIDYFSFFRNIEVNLFGRDPESAGSCGVQFLEDLKSSSEIILGDWKRRSRFAKFREKACYFFRVWL